MRSQTTKNIFITGLIECQEITAIGIVGKTMSDIEPQILLGLYYQYILRCKEDYDSLNGLENYDGLYMKRLFLYLLLYVLPILNNYIATIIDNEDDKSMKEKLYFKLIFEYVDSINLDVFIDMFARCYHMPESIKQKIKNGYKKEEQTIKNGNNRGNVENISANVRRKSIRIESSLESPPSSSGSGPININPIAIVPLIPLIIIGAVIGGVLCGSFFCAKKLIEAIKKRKRNGNRRGNGNERGNGN